jgi:hypothetical protein
MQSLSAAAVAVIALGVAVIIMWRRNWQASRIIVVLMLLAGFGLTGGAFGAAARTGGEHIGSAIETTTAKLFGVGVPLLLVAVLIALVAVDMKDRTIHKATPWVALLLPTMMAVVGGMYIGAGDDALNLLGQGMASLANIAQHLG